MTEEKNKDLKAQKQLQELLMSVKEAWIADMKSLQLGFRDEEWEKRWAKSQTGLQLLKATKPLFTKAVLEDAGLYPAVAFENLT